jgi:UDP-glucose 4-epimerase
MSRILVTGGFGFIGTAVLGQLVKYREENKLDFEIRAMDLKRPEFPGVEGRQGSILDISDLSEAVRGCDRVLHLAAFLGVNRSDTRQLDCMNINVMGTMNVLNACVQERVKKIAFSSSSEVYGDQVVFPIKETNPLNPKSVYAVSKLACEEYVKAYSGRYHLDYAMVRFFNVYGPGQVGQFVVPRFVAAVQKGEAPQVYGDGGQDRAFCYVDDAAKGVLLALFSEKANGHVFNIGNPGERYTILQLAQKVIAASGKKLEPKFIPFTQSDRKVEREIAARYPDISKAQEVLGYQPSVDLDTGIRRMLGGVIAENWTR